MLTIDTDCGSNCSVTYDIEAPLNVAVRGELRSGDIGLSGVGKTDVTVTSGDIMVSKATGDVRAKATSGDVDVVDSTGKATVLSTSGDVRALNINGAVEARTTSGDVDVKVTTVSSVIAKATSGDVNVIVPPGSYQIRTDTGSGDAQVVGVVNDPKAKSVIDLSATSGDAILSAVPAA